MRRVPLCVEYVVESPKVAASEASTLSDSRARSGLSAGRRTTLSSMGNSLC